MENIGERIIYCERCGFVLGINDRTIRACGEEILTCSHCKIPMKFLDRDDIVSYKDWQLGENQAFLGMNGYLGEGKWGEFDYHKDLEKKAVDEYISKLPTFDKYAMYDRLDGWYKGRTDSLNRYKELQAQKAAAEAARPKCPTCGSTNIKRISGGERVASVLGLGILSRKIGKSYKCLDCKYTW